MRRSKVKASEEVQRIIDRCIREGRLTLDQIRARLLDEVPAEQVPSRSSIHRYKAHADELSARMRDMDVAARAIVAELGEDPNDRAGALLTQAVTTAATHVALRAQSEDEISIDDARQLARMAKDVIAARRGGLAERKELERLAVERRDREVKQQLESMSQKGVISADTLHAIRTQIYGLPE